MSELFPTPPSPRRMTLRRDDLDDMVSSGEPVQFRDSVKTQTSHDSPINLFIYTI